MALLTRRDDGRLSHRTTMSPRDIVGCNVQRLRRRYESRAPRGSATWAADDDVHFRNERHRQDLWMVWQCGVHEYAALADDSPAARCRASDRSGRFHQPDYRIPGADRGVCDVLVHDGGDVDLPQLLGGERSDGRNAGD